MFFVLILILGSMAGAVDAAKPVRLLVVTGGHPYDQARFFAMFESFRGIEWEHYNLSDDADVFDSIDDWNYDVLLLYNMTATITPKRFGHFKALLDMGVGLVPFHHGGLSWTNEPGIRDVFGVQFPQAPNYGFYIGQTFQYQVADREHPITRGLEDFTVTDETYTGYHGEGRPGNHVLFTTEHTPSDHELAWVRQVSKSRVFTIQGGHDAQTFDHPEFRQVLNRGILWTAGKLENPASPSRFERFGDEAVWVQAAQWRHGKSRWPFSMLERRIKAAKDAAAIAALSQNLLNLLAQAESPEARLRVCQLLAQQGDPAVLPVMEPYLLQEESVHIARMVVEAIGGREASAVIRSAYSKAPAGIKPSLAQSMGVLEDKAAFPLLVAAADSGDVALQEKATQALGHIGGEKVWRILWKRRAILHAATPLEWREAVLECGERFLTEGDASWAEKVFEKLWESDLGDTFYRSAALPGLARADSGVALEALHSAMPASGGAFLQAAAFLPMDAFEELLEENWSSLDASQKVPWIYLARIRKAVALHEPLRLKLDAAKSDAFLFAAYAYLSDFAGAEDVTAMLQSLGAVESRQERLAFYLGRSDGSQVDKTLMALLQEEGDAFQDVLALDVLAFRRTREALPLFVKALDSQERSVRKSAVSGLALLAGPGDLDVFLGRLQVAETSKARRDVSKVILAIVEKSKDDAAILETLDAAMEGADANVEKELTKAVVALGTDAARDKLMDWVEADPESARGMVALRGLCTWENAGPASFLFDLARKHPGSRTALLALRGYFHLISLGPADPAKVMEQLQKSLSLMERAEERRMFLSALAQYPSVRAMEMAVGMLQDERVLPEAVLTIISMADPLSFQYPEASGAALEKAMAYVKSEEQKTEIQTLLEKIEERRDTLVQSWTFEQDAEGWSEPHQCNLSVADGVLLVEATGVDPFFHNRFDMPGGTYLLRMRVRTDKADFAQVFWSTDATPTIGPEGTFATFGMEPGDGKWHEYTVEIRPDSALKMLRLDTGGQENLTEIDYIQIYKTGEIDYP